MKFQLITLALSVLLLSNANAVRLSQKSLQAANPAEEKAKVDAVQKELTEIQANVQNGSITAEQGESLGR